VTVTALGVDAPVCGNGIKEFGETCDGNDNAACVDQCQEHCTCPQVCADGELKSLSILSTAQRFLYKAHLNDPDGRNSIIDPRNGVALEITDQIGAVDLAIPGGDGGWTKSLPNRGRFRWTGDGSIDGLRIFKLRRKALPSGGYWELLIKGRGVPGAGTIDLRHVLDFWLTLDGTCHSATW
jgi:hypothetical protein